MRFLIVPLASSAFVSEAARGAIGGGATKSIYAMSKVLLPLIDLRRVGVLANRAHVLVGTHATLVHLLRVHTILRVQVLHLTGREHAVMQPSSFILARKLFKSARHCSLRASFKGSGPCA